MRSSEISQAFIEYHQNRGYTVLLSASLLDPSIPMSFVMSAGLVQIENQLRQRDKWNGGRYVLLQKCFRHFDLQTVGTTNMHLSLFEMPAAFSFRLDGKAAAIRSMWELITSTLGCPKDSLWVTYFAGGVVCGHTFAEDTEVYQAWREIGILQERIVGSGVDTNFWKQGDGIGEMNHYRKCGTSTELFFDRGAHLSCGHSCSPGCRCGRFIEVANLLFVTSEIDTETNALQPMAAPFSELVVGTERLAMVLQKRDSIFDIDSIAAIKAVIRKFEHIDGVPPEIASVSENILADHWRALFFLVADGAPPPGKDGRQRIVKILVRGILARQILLGIHPADSLPAIADTFVAIHRESTKLDKARDTVINYITGESTRFVQTLAKGQCEFSKYLARRGDSTLTDDQIVYLEKRLGVPIALVEIWLLEKRLPFDRPAYERALRKWRLSEGAY